MNYSEYLFEDDFYKNSKGLDRYLGRIGNTFDTVFVYHHPETNKWYEASKETGRPTKKEITNPETITIKGKTCNAFESEDNCKNPNCSWFNHSQVGLAGGAYPPGYDGSLDS